MKLPRRQFLHLVAGAAALPTIPRVAWAQAYPSRPVRCIVGYAPGGGTDIFVRLVGQSLPARLGQPFIIENRSGASSNIATEAVIRAPADGYTLTDAAAAINAALFDNLNFNFIRDMALVGVSRGPLVVAVHPSVPVKTIPEFITYAKANPGKIAMGSSGTGGINHMAGELFRTMTGINMTHVPYRGSGLMLNDLLSGQVQCAFDGTVSSIGHIRAGRLRALGVGNATRVEGLSDVPAIAEFVPGYEASGWIGLGAPRNTPAEIIDKLNREINAGLADPRIRARIADLGIPRSRSHRPSTASSSSKKPRNGRRWWSLRASSRNDPGWHSIISRSAKSQACGLAEEVTQYAGRFRFVREDAERVIVECTFIQPRHFPVMNCSR
jgi:tripartite-type tricarboxylate transporter receptor subunit TctC